VEQLRGALLGPAPPATEPIRGINSIQFTSDGARWYVLSITWEAERPGLTLAPEYLRPAG
jgi:hypothetical protein